MTLAPHVVFGYLPVAIIIIIAIVIGCALLFLNHVMAQRPRELTAKKFEPYECGVPLQGDARQQFSVRYYLVGIIFLIFDVEVIFMYPWTIVYKHVVKNNPFILYEMIFFFVVLLGGYIYLRMRKAFSWD